MYGCLSDSGYAEAVGSCLAAQSTPAEWTVLGVALAGVALVSWLAWLGEFKLRDI